MMQAGILLQAQAWLCGLNFWTIQVQHCLHVSDHQVFVPCVFLMQFTYKHMQQWHSLIQICCDTNETCNKLHVAKVHCGSGWMFSTFRELLEDFLLFLSSCDCRIFQLIKHVLKGLMVKHIQNDSHSKTQTGEYKHRAALFFDVFVWGSNTCRDDIVYLCVGLWWWCFSSVIVTINLYTTFLCFSCPCQHSARTLYAHHNVHRQQNLPNWDIMAWWCVVV